MNSLVENKKLLYALVAAASLCIIFTSELLPPINEFFELYPFSPTVLAFACVV